MRLSGSQVADVLEQAVENVFAADQQSKIGGMIQVIVAECGPGTYVVLATCKTDEEPRATLLAATVL